jgi:hypothetical protein
MSAKRTLLWCSLVTAAIGGYYGAPLVIPHSDRRVLLPGRTSRGHRVFEEACEQCHTPFRGVRSDACKRCHQAGLTAGEDTHPESKFADPRNAERVAALDARECVACHREHVPGATREGGVTLPADFCGACHQDIARERPSHAGFSFDGCARAGCHRFHDNRGLYEGFLAKHLHEPENLPPAAVVAMVAEPSPRPLGAADADAPGGARTDDALLDWLASAHARAGVNCTACHATREGPAAMLEWKDNPGDASCGGCHASEQAGFARSQHGVREAVGLSPLTPALARLPMRPEARDRPLGCDTCHGAHAYDRRRAQADACLGCHDDRHSRGWASSRHARAFRLELSGAAEPETGVSCATCHLPRRRHRVRGADAVHVEHDASAALRPREKMLRGVCLRCHGLGFALDALADAELMARNFNGRPSAHVESLEMVERRLHDEASGGGGP